jgi:hypothetical protein
VMKTPSQTNEAKRVADAFSRSGYHIPTREAQH